MKKNYEKSRSFYAVFFTLTEMVVAIAIIIIIAGIAIPGVMKILNNANKARAVGQINSFKTAITSFQLDMGRMPKSLSELVRNPGDKKWEGPYLGDTTVVPKDPWGSDYIYEYPSSHGPDTYEIKSYGKDRAPGGQGINADLSNWTTE